MTNYYTDRECGSRPRLNEEIDLRTWGGIYTLIQRRKADGSFGYRFPQECADGHAFCGCDEKAFDRVLAAEVPFLDLPMSADVLPETPAVLDVLEFCAASTGHPQQGAYHSFFRHHHLTWDRPSGLAEFVGEVNTIFARCGVAFELSTDGQAYRVLPENLAKAIAWTLFNTGDQHTDSLLEGARVRITSPKPPDRQDAIEKIWDAFERLKTLEPGNGKKAQAEALLDRVAVRGSPMRAVLDEEARALTEIGNRFHIRHWEADRTSLTADQVDYLFMRMFAFIRFLLKATGRGG